MTFLFQVFSGLLPGPSRLLQTEAFSTLTSILQPLPLLCSPTPPSTPSLPHLTFIILFSSAYLCLEDTAFKGAFVSIAAL